MSEAVVHAHDPKITSNLHGFPSRSVLDLNPVSHPFAVTICEASLRLLIQSKEQRDGRGVRQGNQVYGPVLDSSGAVVDPGAGIRIFVYLTARSFDGYVFQAIEAKARCFKAILRRSVTVRVVEDVDDVVLSAAEAKALVAGDPDVLRRVQLQTEIVKMEALRAAHLDQQIQARWELKRLPQRIADLRARVKAIADDVAFRDIHTPRPNAQGDKPFSFVVDGRAYTDRVEAAPALAAAVERGTEASFTAGQATGSTPSTPIAAYRGFQVTVRPAGSGTIRLGLRCPDRSDALEYATARTLDVAQVPAYGIGLFQRLDNLLDALGAELRAAQDGLAREETNLASYTDQLARPFDREEALGSAQRDLARIDRKLTHHSGRSAQPAPCTNAGLDEEAAA
jgi:hypothetical protein